MNDRPDDPESGAGEPRPPKIKAEDNPWYLLATLYGVPQSWSDGLREKNRVAWNRYFAADLDEETRANLIEEKRRPAEELTPFSLEELQEVKRAFAKCCKASKKKLALPASDAEIDFSNVKFEQDVFFEGYVFSRPPGFQSAAFSGWASSDGATFSGEAGFDGATFSGVAGFVCAKFLRSSSFVNAEMKGETFFEDAVFKTEPPRFFGAKLHQGTVWRGIT